ncbi:MAG: hypothetical protein IPN34_09940 [Planctomycetes bacterium]|nr:hypothetical protein [Planctomycetota bacterium]
MRTLSFATILCAGALLAGCASNGNPRVTSLCSALDVGDYARVQSELPTLNAESPSDGTLVVGHGLDLVEMPPDAPESDLREMRRLLAALDVPGPLQTRVGYGRGLAAMKDGDDAAARVHFETLVHTSDARASDRASAYFALAVLDPDPDGLPNRAHWARYRRLVSEGAEGVEPELLAKVEGALGGAEADAEALAARRDL